MTLVTTEIWPRPPAYIVMAADRRISRAWKPVPTGKVVRPARGEACRYQLLRDGRSAARSERLWMDKWLQDFLNLHTTASTLRALADALALSLNAIPARPDAALRFSTCRARIRRQPEFCSLEMSTTMVSPCWASGRRARTRRQDALQIGPDRRDLPKRRLRAHVAAWEALDASFGRMLALPDFNGIRGRRRALDGAIQDGRDPRSTTSSLRGR